MNVASLFVAADNQLLKHLERDSEFQQQLGQYSPVSGEVLTKFAYEEYETPAAFGQFIMIRPIPLLRTNGPHILTGAWNGPTYSCYVTAE